MSASRDDDTSRLDTEPVSAHAKGAAAGKTTAAAPGALPDIKALSPADLRGLVAQLGLPAFRADQLVAWLHGRGVSSFDQMTDLGLPLRTELASRFSIGRAVTKKRVESRIDGTRKYLVRFSDGETVETVGLPVGDRLTVCFSTQAGCAMACALCATGKQGLSRSLSAGEMVDQVRLAGDDFGMRVTNAVAMGQGEPFANYDATLAALRFMNAPKGLGIGARHLTLSTCGIIKGIEQLAEEPEQFTLAVSLHSAVQATRNRMVPAMRAYPLPRLRAAMERYARASGRRPTIEYAMIDGVNDTIPERDALVAFCRGMMCHVNLIPMNDTGSRSLHRSTETTVRGFANALRAAGVEVSERVERGADIDAACGQLKRQAQD